MQRRASRWGCRADRSNSGDGGGRPVTSPSRIVPDGAESPVFPPLDRAVVKALACELVAETKQPLSRQSLGDLATRAHAALGKAISRSTVSRILAHDAIKPWQYRYWIFPRDPLFALKAGPILDLYEGLWQDQPLGLKDYTLRGHK